MGAAYDQLVFDLDGTLSDPKTGVFNCFNHALAENGFRPIPEPQVHDYIGPPLDVSFSHATGSDDPEMLSLLVATYRERYSRLGYAENRLYDGIPEMLDALGKRQVPLGVCTSKRVDFAEIILAMFGIRGHFSFVDGGDIGIPKTVQLNRLVENGTASSKALMIGDRLVDLEAARHSGLSGAGVLWGYGSQKELSAGDPAHLFLKPEEIVGLFT